MADIPFFGFTPMEGQGTEFDIASGHPAILVREQARTDRQTREEHRQHEREQRALRLLESLEGQGGEVVRRLLDTAVERVRTLAGTDPELTMILGVLAQVLGPDLAVAETLATEMVTDFCVSYLRPRRMHPPGDRP